MNERSVSLLGCLNVFEYHMQRAVRPIRQYKNIHASSFKVIGVNELPSKQTGIAAGRVPIPQSVPRRAWTTRLQRLAQHTDRTRLGLNRKLRITDIGCDHAWLCFALTEVGVASYAIAVDKREGPLRSAQSSAQLHSLRKHLPVEFRLGDGFAPLHLSDELDTAIIAGIGVPTMQEILRCVHPPTSLGINTLVLQPRVEWSAQLRHLLLLRGWRIVHESLHIDRYATCSSLGHLESNHVSFSLAKTSSTLCLMNDLFAVVLSGVFPCVWCF